MIQEIKAKTLLSKVKQDTYFGLTYNLNLYRGCQHGCIYCDSRSSCYQIGDLSQIRFKSNAIELLDKELRSKKIKGTIGFGSMNDPYMPLENKMELTKKALETICKYHFPIHIITKSSLVLRDLQLIQKISRTYAAISITITTSDDKLAGIIEPKAPASSERFKTLRILSENGIYCGVMLMPVLPFINDTEKNIHEILDLAKINGAHYILPMMGLTLRDGSREYFYNQLDTSFPGIKERYINAFGNQYSCFSPNYKNLNRIIQLKLKKLKLADRMNFYSPKEDIQLKLF